MQHLYCFYTKFFSKLDKFVGQIVKKVIFKYTDMKSLDLQILNTRNIVFTMYDRNFFRFFMYLDNERFDQVFSEARAVWTNQLTTRKDIQVIFAVGNVLRVLQNAAYVNVSATRSGHKAKHSFRIWAILPQPDNQNRCAQVSHSCHTFCPVCPMGL